MTAPPAFEASAVGRPPLLSREDVAAGPPRGNSLVLSSRRLHSRVVVISAQGDIDASNTEAVTAYTLQQGTRCRALIIDLGGLNFFAIEGFSALHRIAVNCARRATIWAIVPGDAACRVLQICDPEGALPRVDSLTAALVMCTAQLRRRPRVIASTRDAHR